MKFRDLAGLLGWLALSFAAAASGIWIHPGDWYYALQKPAWNPPAWIFPIVWTFLYTAMAVAAWRIWKKYGWQGAGKELKLFLLQLLLNALWTPIFFAWHQMGLAVIELSLLTIAVFLTWRAFRQKDRLAAALLVPYLMWVSFASFLNFTIWRLNS